MSAISRRDIGDTGAGFLKDVWSEVSMKKMSEQFADKIRKYSEVGEDLKNQDIHQIIDICKMTIEVRAHFSKINKDPHEKA